MMKKNKSPFTMFQIIAFGVVPIIAILSVWIIDVVMVIQAIKSGDAEAFNSTILCLIVLTLFIISIAIEFASTPERETNTQSRKGAIKNESTKKL